METALTFSSLLSQDPEEVESNPLDLNDGMDDRSQVPMAHTPATDWLSEAGQALFAQSPAVSVSQVQADADAALKMSDRLSGPLGLDSARPALVLSDVRAQPPKLDRGYATQQKDAEGDLPDMTAIIHTLMLHRAHST